MAWAGWPTAPKRASSRCAPFFSITRPSRLANRSRRPWAARSKLPIVPYSSLLTSVDLARDVGSTLVAAAFAPSGLYWMSVGDSALYLCRDGALTQLNHPHTLGAKLAELVKRGVMSPEDAAIDPDRDALTSYVGAGGIAQIDSPSEGVAVTAGDIVILCSDGLYRALSHEEIARIATQRRRRAGSRRHADCERTCTRTSASG